MGNIDVKKIRAKLGLTQTAFANQLGVDVSSVQKWEAGKKISTPKLRKLMELDQYSNTNSSLNNVSNQQFKDGVDWHNSIESMIELMIKQQETITKMLEQHDRLIKLLERR